MEQFDAVVVGAGPNGLSAAVRLAERGFSTCVVERADHPGGGLHSLTLTEPGFVHDQCSAIHPMGVLSPYWSQLGLERHGLIWESGRSSVAHPLEGRPAAMLYRDLAQTAERLGQHDGRAWARVFEPFLGNGQDLLADLLGPLRFPRHLLSAIRFGLLAHRSARAVGEAKFRDGAARALFAGLCAHSILPLERRPSAAFGLIFGITAHLRDWPCVRGGSQRLADALVARFLELGGQLRVGQDIDHLGELPESRVVLLDLVPERVVHVARDHLPSSYKKRLERYVYGPATFKVDYTLDGPIPWSDPEVNGASTVHVGGTLDEIAVSERGVWHGKAPSAPFLIVCQQSELDASRAPDGKRTGYAYCHVPFDYDGDVSAAIDAQIERFAPGFRDVVRTRHLTSPRAFRRINPNFVGGTITGGAATLSQLFTRPVARLDPYSTPNSRVFICSAATPPGGGIHGMCGYHAAESAIRRLERRHGSSFLSSI